MIDRETIERLVKELTSQMFIIGKNSVETDSFYITILRKEGETE